MADFVDVLNSILAKVQLSGRSALSPSEARLYLVNRFVIELEGGGLSGFLYNADVPGDSRQDAFPTFLADTIDAVRTLHTASAGDLLERAACLSAAMVDGHPLGAEAARRCDAELAAIEDQLLEACPALWDSLEAAAARQQ